MSAPLVALRLLLVGALVSPVLASVPAGASTVDAGSPAVMLVVDTSGSMNESDGTSLLKIDGARRALIDFVRAVPAGTRVGLRTYPGGVETGLDGCSVGELRTNLDNQDLSTVDAVIRGLQASGDTPTAPALQKASEDLRAKGLTQATIVLVSDGLSTCGGDPCDVAKQIASTGIDITVNTVGFRISAEGQQQLQCIAEATHGIYTDAANTGELTAQLTELSQPLLDVQLDFPTFVKAAVGTDDEGLVTIKASVNNVGAGRVDAAQVSISFTGSTRPVVIGPRRKLGNVAPGQTTEVEFQFRPPLGASDPTISFDVIAQGRNSNPRTKQGRITVNSQVSLDDAGPILKDAKRLAILGDSYSSGEGAGSYERGTDLLSNGCHRSRKTYAVPLWDAKKADGYHADVFACSGATSQALDFTNKDNGTEPPQVERLRRSPPYDAVMMTMGGNDIGFSWIAKTCLTAPSCQKIHNSRLSAASGLVDVLADGYRTVEGSLNTQTNITGRAGKPAPLIVLAYPNPMPIQSQLDCSNAFSIGEQHFFQKLVETLNTSARTAVERLASEGLPVYFVPDTIDAFQPEHTYCSREPYINRLSTKKDLQAIAGVAVGGLELSLPGPLLGSQIRRLPVSDAVKGKLINKVNEQVHPSALGYQAETVELVRWSTTAPARKPVRRTATFLPVITNPNPGVTVQVGASSQTPTLTPGGVIQVQGGGLPASTQVTLTLQSLPVTLGSAVTDDRGGVSIVTRIPTGTRPGKHHLVITVDDLSERPTSISQAIEVRRDRPWWSWPLAGTGVASLLAGAAVWRRRAFGGG